MTTLARRGRRIIHFVLPRQVDAACGAKFFSQGTSEVRLVTCGKCKATLAEYAAHLEPRPLAQASA